MPIAIDSTFLNIRAAAILTNSYVASTIIGGNTNVRPTPRDYNQLALYCAFTIGSLTSCSIKVEFAPYPAAATYYQEADETSSVSANVDTRAVNLVLHQLSITGNYRFQIPIMDEVIKVSAIGTGTVTSSSLQIDAGLIKNYS